MSIYNLYTYGLKEWKGDVCTQPPPSLRERGQGPRQPTARWAPPFLYHPQPSPQKKTTVPILCSSVPYNYCTLVISLDDIWFYFAWFWTFNFFSFNTMFLRFICIDNYTRGSFISLPYSISLYKHSTIYWNILLKDKWVVSTLGPSEIKKNDHN